MLSIPITHMKHAVGVSGTKFFIYFVYFNTFFYSLDASGLFYFCALFFLSTDKLKRHVKCF